VRAWPFSRALTVLPTPENLCTRSRNVAYNIGTATELGGMVLVMKGGTNLPPSDQIWGCKFLGTAAAQFGAIHYMPLLVLWPPVACLYSYFFRQTGRVHTGVFLVTLFMVWLLAAFGDFAVVPWRSRVLYQARLTKPRGGPRLQR
jgi:hypothetical protein